MTDERDELVLDQVGCARCLGDGHPGLTFRRLTNPVELTIEIAAGDDDRLIFTHWAPCPTNGEPILLATRDAE